MTFIYALIPLSCLFTVLSFGGATSGIVLFQILVYILLFEKIKRFTSLRMLPIPICTASVIMRFFALYTLAHPSLGVWRGIALAIAVFALSCWAAHNRDSAIYSAAPVFFMSVMIAVYVIAVSFSDPLRGGFELPSVAESISAVVCPVSSCLAVCDQTSFCPLKRQKGTVAGVAVCCVFLLFVSANAEFEFMTVPLTAVISALEIKAVSSVILKREEE